MAEFNKNKYIFSSSASIIDIGEDARKAREKQISFMLKELFLYKILVKDLVNVAPSYRDRNLILNIANYIYQDYEIFERIQKRRELPITMIAKRTRVSRTFLEIWTDYILVYMIILSNPNYKYIQDYIKIEKRENSTSIMELDNSSENEVKKGIILKVNKRSILVLTSDGEFLKLKKEDGDKVGQGVRRQEKKGIRNYKLQISIASVLMIFIMAGAYFQYTKPVRVVIVDTTSQVKFNLNRFNKIIYAYSPTQKGKDLIAGVKPEYRGIDEVLKDSLEYAKSNEMIPDKSILVTVSGDALKYGALKETARYVKKEKIGVLVNNYGVKHNLKDMVKDEEEAKDE